MFNLVLLVDVCLAVWIFYLVLIIWVCFVVWIVFQFGFHSSGGFDGSDFCSVFTIWVAWFRLFLFCFGSWVGFGGLVCFCLVLLI